MPLVMAPALPNPLVVVGFVSLSRYGIFFAVLFMHYYPCAVGNRLLFTWTPFHDFSSHL